MQNKKKNGCHTGRNNQDLKKIHSLMAWWETFYLINIRFPHYSRHDINEILLNTIALTLTHSLIISLRGEVWIYKTSLTPPLFIERPVSRQECERFRDVDFASFNDIYIVFCFDGVIFFCLHFIASSVLDINVREFRRVLKTKTNKAKTQHNMCWTPLYVNKHK
jgi:hypothetical protein